MCRAHQAVYDRASGCDTGADGEGTRDAAEEALVGLGQFVELLYGINLGVQGLAILLIERLEYPVRRVAKLLGLLESLGGYERFDASFLLQRESGIGGLFPPLGDLTSYRGIDIAYPRADRIHQFLD